MQHSGQAEKLSTTSKGVGHNSGLRPLIARFRFKDRVAHHEQSRVLKLFAVPKSDAQSCCTIYATALNSSCRDEFTGRDSKKIRPGMNRVRKNCLLTRHVEQRRDRRIA
jgi:hypothetical protein